MAASYERIIWPIGGRALREDHPVNALSLPACIEGEVESIVPKEWCRIRELAYCTNVMKTEPSPMALLSRDKKVVS